MRRTELAEGAEQILRAIKESSILHILSKSLESGAHRTPEGIVPELLGSLKKYSLEAQKFNRAAKELADIFGLTELEDTNLWSQLLDLENRPMIYKTYQGVKFAADYLPKIVRMVQPELLSEIEQSNKGESSKYRGRSLLSVVVIEEKDRLSSPARLSNVLESIQLLYEACALIMDIPPEGLSVVACDSGSDKSFDFLGAAKVMECVKEVILSLWDRVVFFRERQFSERIDLIAKSLPIIDRIGELEQGKKLGPEQAELLRRNIFEGVHKFTESGAIIPEIEEKSHYNPRLLMSPVQKLLASAPTEEVAISEDAESISTKQSDLSALSDDEREELFRLLKKTRQGDDEQNSHETPEVQ